MPGQKPTKITKKERNKEEFMSIAGQWTFFYSWGCSGTYNQTSITFNANGTFKTGDGFSGQWATNAGDV